MSQFYLASGFFNPEQIKVVEKIEQLSERTGISVISPRKLTENRGLDMSINDPVLRDIYSKEIFRGNVDAINASDKLLVNLSQPYDIGTIWELGYFCGTKQNKSYSTDITVIDGTDEDLLKWLNKLPTIFDEIHQVRDGSPQKFVVTDFESAVNAIINSTSSPDHKFLICIDDRKFDPIFTLGFLYSYIPVDQLFTYSEKGYGSNVMIAESIANHFTSKPTDDCDLTISVSKNQKIKVIE